MTDEMEGLVTLLESVPDTYEDFVVCTALMASDFGILDEMTDFIEIHPDCTSSQILEWVVDLRGMKPVVTIDGTST